MKVNEIIIVEGIHDIGFLSTFLDAFYIQTHGSSLPKDTIDQILHYKSIGKEFIILTDPDFPGGKIRNKLLEIIPEAKIGFLDKKKARTSKKVGVEHAKKGYIEEIMSNLVSFSSKNTNITNDDLNDLGLNGNENSSKLREFISNRLYLGKCNAKQFLKRINLLDINVSRLKELKEEYERKSSNN